MSDLTKELKRDLENLYTLRDEVRVRLHLCNQEAKEKWGNLETEIERLQDNAARTTKRSMTDLIRALQDFKSHIKG